MGVMMPQTLSRHQRVRGYMLQLNPEDRMSAKEQKFSLSSSHTFPPFPITPVQRAGMRECDSLMNDEK